MFRSNCLVLNGRFFLNSRSYSTQKQLRAKLQEKFYIVQVKADSSAVPGKCPQTHQSSSISELSARVTKDHWLRIFYAISDVLKIYKNQLRLQVAKVGVDDAFINGTKKKGEEVIKKVAEKTPVKMKELSNASREQLIVFKESESFAKLKNSPAAVMELAAKAKEYWIKFEKSPLKDRIVNVVTICVFYGKKGGTELIKFYKHVFKAPVPKMKH